MAFASIHPSVPAGATEAKEKPSDSHASIGEGTNAPWSFLDRKQCVVTFDEPHDPMNPQQWSTRKK